MKWTQIRFFIEWDQEDEAKKYIDTLLACEVFGKIIDTVGPTLRNWRFHRRAATDEHGHIFSFNMLCKKGRAKKIDTVVRKHPVVKLLLKGKFITKIMTQRRKDLTDDSWCKEIRKSWTPMIQGISMMWLSLAREMLKSAPFNTSFDRTYENLSRLTNVYEELEVKMKETWEQRLSHPILHHVAAVFGQYPIWADVRMPMQF